MPAGPRIRTNNAFGFTLNNPLAAGGTTLNSVELAILAEVVAAHAIITLDPLRQFGEPELVIVTAHAPGAQTATIVRGAFGTIARSHPVSTVWLHGPITDDVIAIVTTTTRPTDPYMGQIVYESNLNKYSSYTGGAWVGLIPPGLISPYGADAAPSGWLSCNGAAVSRTVYADLFATIGVNYGAGDTTTTFNVPDLQDRFPLGKGTTFPNFPSGAGGTGGTKDAVVVTHNHTQDSHGHTQNSHGHTQDAHGHTSDDNQTGSHEHNAEVNQFVITAGAGPYRARDDGGSGQFVTFTTTTAHAGDHNHDITVNGTTATNQGTTATNNGTTATNQASGVSGTNANMPPYQTVRYIIKV